MFKNNNSQNLSRCNTDLMGFQMQCFFPSKLKIHLLIKFLVKVTLKVTSWFIQCCIQIYKIIQSQVKKKKLSQTFTFMLSAFKTVVFKLKKIIELHSGLNGEGISLQPFQNNAHFPFYFKMF